MVLAIVYLLIYLFSAGFLRFMYKRRLRDTTHEEYKGHMKFIMFCPVFNTIFLFAFFITIVAETLLEAIDSL